jgi:hypothetical protein
MYHCIDDDVAKDCVIGMTTSLANGWVGDITLLKYNFILISIPNSFGSFGIWYCSLSLSLQSLETVRKLCLRVFYLYDKNCSYLCETEFFNNSDKLNIGLWTWHVFMDKKELHKCSR